MMVLRAAAGVLLVAACGAEGGVVGGRALQVGPPSCAVPAATRRDCAYPGIRPADCLARGCCPDTNASSTPSCFFPSATDFHPEFLPRWHHVPRPFNWMNDPDGPFYDPVHKKYHLFVQYETPRQWAHAVSDDMIRWRQLPQGLQTDAWYDAGGVFSGSTTVLDDAARTPVISYSVSYNTMQALAWPCNRSDPDLVCPPPIPPHLSILMSAGSGGVVQVRGQPHHLFRPRQRHRSPRPR